VIVSACGGNGTPATPPLTATRAPAAASTEMPRTPDPARTIALADLPRRAAVVMIGADGALEVADELGGPRRALTWVDELPFAEPVHRVSVGSPAAELAASAPLVVAHPRAPAVRVVEVCRHAGCVIAVEAGGVPAALRLGFTPAQLASRVSDESFEIELHLDDTAIHTLVTRLDERGRIPHADGALDLAGLAGWLQQIGDTAYFIERRPIPVNLLIHATSGDAQRLVDLLASLDGAALTLAVSPVPAVEAPARGDLLVSPLVFGDLPDDWAVYRRLLARWTELHACAEHALGADPGSRDQIDLVFSIDAEGRVGEIGIEGERRELGRCLAPIVAATPMPPATPGEIAEVRLRMSLAPR
jgi:hypothetical protein